MPSPLSELHHMAKGKLESTQHRPTNNLTDLSFLPDNDFVELLWENGQIVMQNQSYRARKNPPSIKDADKDAGNAINSKMGKFGSTDSIIEDFQVLVPSVEMGMNQNDEDMVPWFNYPINDEYCSDLLHEIAGVTVNEHKTNNEFTPQENISFNKVVKESHNVASHSSAILEQAAAPKFASLRDVESTITKGGDSCKGYRHQQPLLRANNSGKDLDTVGAFPSINGPTQNLGQPSMSSSVINFSHFARSAALLKANLHSNSNMPASDPTSRDGSEIKDKVAVAGNVNLYASKLQNSEPTTAESEVNGTAVVSDEFTTQVCAGSSAVGMLESEKIVEPVVVSSVCSGDGLDGASNDPKETVKRKCPENESSDGPSEDIEEESVIGRKASNARGGNGYKRSRAAEVHNLSERRRRDRINEKMRALQELIPNCNKVDKASMLDEAIDYLKALQHQVQIMSMGSGLCMPPMMYPTGMQHLRASHMGHFAHMGTAMGMGMNFQMGTYDLNGGSLGYPMFPASPIANACSPPITASSTFVRALGPNLQAFMIPGQGLPMPMPHSPFIPMHGGPPVRPTMGKNACGAAAHVKTLGGFPGSSSRDVIQNMNMQSIKKNDAKWPINQMCSQATNEDFVESVLLKERDQATGF